MTNKVQLIQDTFVGRIENIATVIIGVLNISKSRENKAWLP